MDTTETWNTLIGKSTISGDIDALFYFITYTGAIILALVTTLMIIFVVKYRLRGPLHTTSGVADNTALEIFWTLVPTILIMIVFVWGFKDFIKIFIVPANAIEVNVRAQMWFWSFDYPDGASSVNELTVPVNKPVKLIMSSQDVIHSFFVPNFRVKMDVLPNRYTIMWFEATDTGSYQLFCAEYCGKGHSEMLGKVRVVSEEEFDKWLAASSGPAEGESMASYGARMYLKKGCVTCHSVDGAENTGPTFKGVFGRQEVLADGTSLTVDENYLRESMLNPMAKLVAGFDPVMPTYQGILKPQEIDGIIQYLKTLE